MKTATVGKSPAGIFARMVLCCILATVGLLVGCSGPAPSSPSESGTPSEPSTPSESSESSDESPSFAPRNLSIGTASPGGFFYIAGIAMGELLTEKLDGITAIGEETGGAVENAHLIHRREVEIALISEPIGYEAVQGTGVFEEQLQLSQIVRMAPILFHIATIKDTGIETIPDLQGKRVSIGTFGAIGNQLFLNIFGAYGFGENDFTPHYLGFVESMDAVADGTIDAGTVSGSVPSAAVESLATRRDIKLISLDEDVVAPLVEGLPNYIETVPAGSYQGQDEDVKMLAWRTGVYVHPDEDEELVYHIVKTLHENLDVLAQAHPEAEKFWLLSEEDVKDTGVPVHPGAERYSRELGVW